MHTTAQPRFLVTGASGELGALVIEELVRSVPSAEIAALVRDPERGAAHRLKALGVQLRTGDYDHPETLDAAFAGTERLLFISSNATEGRVAQHCKVVEAAARAGVSLVAYTSVLHADTSRLSLAADHWETEAALRASGLPFVILRNSWYTENYTARIPVALEHHTLIGAAGDGRIASAARADYAAAAAVVLTSSENPTGRVFELAGDEIYTLSELAAEISRQSGQDVAYRNLDKIAYEQALLGANVPEELAALLADSDAGAAEGALFDDSRQLSALIGRPTTPLATSVAQALRSH